ncbi:hypothetical protein [Alteromonas macleodii]|uniref:hypothetical protein n=1 Tax=Alteromonas macleodii TaxID=28108 RepID=UPI003BAE51AB
MIAANYTAHLYCDCEVCENSHRQEQAEFIGESWNQVATSARKQGWRISQDRTRCYAPGHKIKRTTKQ